jgi:hypothetical protein
VGRQRHGSQLAVQLGAVDRLELAYGGLFLAEGLDDAHAGQVLVQAGQGVADQLAYLGVGAARGVPVASGRYHDGHQGQHHDQAQQGRHDHEDDDHGDEEPDAGHKTGQAALDQAFQHVDVGGHAGQELARALRLEKPEGLGQEVGENLLTKVVEVLLADPRDLEGLQPGEHEVGRADHDVGHAGDGHRPHGLVVDEAVVDGPPNQGGPGQGGAQGGQDDPHGHQDPAPVGP